MRCSRIWARRDRSALVASLADVIRSKEAANREKDRAQLPALRRTLEILRERRRRSRRGARAARMTDQPLGSDRGPDAVAILQGVAAPRSPRGRPSRGPAELPQARAARGEDQTALRELPPARAARGEDQTALRAEGRPSCRRHERPEARTKRPFEPRAGRVAAGTSGPRRGPNRRHPDGRGRATGGDSAPRAPPGVLARGGLLARGRDRPASRCPPGRTAGHLAGQQARRPRLPGPLRPSRHRALLGCVAGDEIVCPYHGWRYAADGRCTAIPQPEDPTRVPARARVTAYRCRERYGLIWVALEEPRWPFPDLPDLEAPGWKTVPCGPFAWNAEASRQIENFTDLGHFPWVHPGLLGDPSRVVVVPPEVRTEGPCCTISSSGRRPGARRSTRCSRTRTARCRPASLATSCMCRTPSSCT